SYPSCNLNFSNLGKLYRQRLYATKPDEIVALDERPGVCTTSVFNKESAYSFNSASLASGFLF
ncbi:hypothetical protein ABS250_18440, partial [Acinetobacter nosocomialis]